VIPLFPNNIRLTVEQELSTIRIALGYIRLATVDFLAEKGNRFVCKTRGIYFVKKIRGRGKT
jgi:hypothetical protein